MNGKKKLIIIFAVIIIMSGITLSYTHIQKVQKYDLDIITPVTNRDYSLDNKTLIFKQAFTFPENHYRIYKNIQSNQTYLHFINQDLEDADYIIPIDQDEFKLVGDTMLYKGRTFSKDDFRIIDKAEDKSGKNTFLVQLRQPPPTAKPFGLQEFMQGFQVVTVLLAIILYFIESSKEKSISRRKIYQNLELASIDLFRFEMQYHDKIYWIYDNDPKSSPPDDDSLKWACNEYICQVMNLFEMAVEFRIQKHFDSEIFLTWVRWFWDVAYTVQFPNIWKDIRTNYTHALRKSLDECISIAKDIRAKHSKASQDDMEKIMEDGYVRFLHYIAKVREFDCNNILEIFKQNLR